MSDTPDGPGGKPPGEGEEPEIEVDNPTKTKLEERKVSDEEKVVNEGKPMAVLAYIIWPVPYLVARDNEFVVFHLRQGGIIFGAVIAAIVLRVIGAFLPSGLGLAFSCLVGIVSLAILVFALIGIYNAVKGTKDPLPLIGALGDKVPV